MDLKRHISDFDEVTILLQELKVIKAKNSRIRRRLKSILKNYSFLNDIVSIDGKDETIENALKNYFKALGFENITKVGKTFKEEDLRLFVNDRLIIFEATGTKNQTNTEEKAHQISKFIPLRKEENSNIKVSGVFVTNHDNKKPFDKRHKKPFDKRIINISKASEYTLVTTTDLFYAFIKIKNGIMTADELIDKLCEFGELKIMGTQ